MSILKKLILAVLILFPIASLASVPLDSVVKQYGFTLSGGMYSSRYRLKKEGTTVYFGPGVHQVVVNGRAFPLAEAPAFREGQLFVSDQFVQLVGREQTTGPRVYWQTVTLDPGHGGRDPGAISPANGLQEKDVVVDIGRKVRSLLKAKGVKVHMTRDRDVFVELEARAAIGNAARSHLFVSIHADACGAAEVCGVQVFYGDDWPESNIDTRTRAFWLAGNMNLSHFVTGNGKMNYRPREEAFFFEVMLKESNKESRRVAGQTVRKMAKALDTDDRGIDTRNLRVIRRSACPAILIESGFLTNPWEARRLARPEYRAQVAKIVAKAILEYLDKNVKKK